MFGSWVLFLQIYFLLPTCVCVTQTVHILHTDSVLYCVCVFMFQGSWVRNCTLSEGLAQVTRNMIYIKLYIFCSEIRFLSPAASFLCCQQVCCMMFAVFVHFSHLLCSFWFHCFSTSPESHRTELNSSPADVMSEDGLLQNRQL